MKIKATRTACGLTQKALVEIIGQSGVKLDKPAYSKIETGAALPTVEQLRAMCQAMGCKPLDLYTEPEIDLIHCMDGEHAPKTAKKDGHRIKRKATFRVPEWCCKWLEPQMLQELGYTTAQQWFLDMVRRTQARYERRLKRAERNRQRTICPHCGAPIENGAQCSCELSA